MWLCRAVTKFKLKLNAVSICAFEMWLEHGEDVVGAMGGRPGTPGAKGGMFGFGQSTARILKENTGVTFK